MVHQLAAHCKAEKIYCTRQDFPLSVTKFEYDLICVNQISRSQEIPTYIGGTSMSAKIKMNVANQGAVINKNIYGHFSEHLGRCIYGGLFVGE